MKKSKKAKKSDTQYAHNDSYCMILPDANSPSEEEIVSAGQS